MARIPLDIDTKANIIVLCVPVVTIPEIKFLGLKLKNIKAACLNLPPQSLIAGLLGLNILKNFDIFLKFRKKVLEITK